MKRYLFIIISSLFLFLLLFPIQSSCQQFLRIGAIIPFSGRWGDHGRECARGILDATRWLNQKGEILGGRLEIILIEDTSQVSELMAAFRKMNESDRILLLYVFSIETAMDLISHVHSHKIPSVLSSMPHHLSNPSKYPFLFTITPTPLDLTKIGIKFILENGGIKGRKPKIVFISSSDYYGKHFLEELKEFAKSSGIEMDHVLFISDFSPQRLVPHVLLPITHYQPDFIFSNLTPKETSILLHEFKKNNLKSRWLCNMRGFDESLLSFEDILVIQPIAPFGEDIPGMLPIKEAHQKWHPYDSHTTSYVEGWTTILVITEALKRLLTEERISRESLKSSLENFNKFVVGGLVPPITISPKDHRPSFESRIFIIKNGKISRFSSFISSSHDKD